MAGRKPEVNDTEILEVFAKSDDPVLFTGEVADHLPIGRNGIRKRLQSLHQQGLVERKKRGNTIVWWISDKN